MQKGQVKKKDTQDHRKSTKDTVTPFDLFMLLITLAAFVLLILLIFAPIDASTRSVLETFDVVLSILFLLDFLNNLYRAPDRWDYMKKWGWLDLLGGIPAPLFTLARIARFIRLIRILHLISSKAVLRMTLRRGAESAFLLTIFVTLVVVITAALLIVRVEQVAPSDLVKIKSSQDGLWWAITTVTTVGYGDLYPVTGEGRLIAALLMTVGVGIFSTLTSYLATLFITPGRNSAVSEENKQLREELVAIKSELTEIKRMLREKQQAQD